MWIFLVLALIIGFGLAARSLNWRKQATEAEFQAYSDAIRERHALSAAWVSKLDRGYVGIGLDGQSVLLGDPSGERTYPMSAVTGAALLADGTPIVPQALVRQKINNLKVRISVDDPDQPHHDYLMFDWPGRRAISANTPFIGGLVQQAQRMLERFPARG